MCVYYICFFHLFMCFVHIFMCLMPLLCVAPEHAAMFAMVMAHFRVHKEYISRGEVRWKLCTGADNDSY